MRQTLRHLCQEPFRIFFPAGALLGVVGVSLWLLYYLGVGIPYPNIAHARLMIEGLMASFIFGFLGTAGPRLTSAPHFTVGEVAILFTLDLLAAGAHAAEAHRFADICFLICLLAFVVIMLKRFRAREDNPPPNFVLVGLGMLCGIAGTASVAWSIEAQYSFAWQFGSALLNECFVLLPVLGVAPFFIGKLLDLPSSNLPESRVFTGEWKRRAAFNLLVGFAIIASFLLESLAPSRFAGWLRVAAVGVYLGLRMPWRGRTFLATHLRLSLAFIFAGFLTIALWPGYRVGELHIVFVTGFNLIVFTVATRVVLGHAGELARLERRLWFLMIASALLFLGMLSRVVADVAPEARTIHLLAAAVSWLVGAGIWIVKVIPKVRIVEPD